MSASDRAAQIKQLEKEWAEDPRWKGIKRGYSAKDVVSLRGAVQVEYTLARRGAEKFWKGLHGSEALCGLGAMTGNQAVQEVQAGLKCIYLSGWQVAGDANTACQMYPDQSLYPVDSVPTVIERINNALLRTDEIHAMNGKFDTDWLVPIIADAEAGFGGNLNAYELTKHMIRAGAAGVHFEDQLSSAKKCGHMGGKVLVSTQDAVHKLVAARLAADVLGVPTILVARTDAKGARLLQSNHDPRDAAFQTGERSVEGFHYVNAGLDQAIARGLAYAPYADLLWCETEDPNIDDAARFAKAIHEKFPGKFLAYNCSPSFNWKAKLSDKQLRTFREDLAALGYRFQFITLAGWHALNFSMFELASAYRETGMHAYSDLQQREFGREGDGYRATKHQAFVGAGYFDAVQTVISGAETSTTAMSGSTEEEQFHEADAH